MILSHAARRQPYPMQVLCATCPDGCWTRWPLLCTSASGRWHCLYAVFVYWSPQGLGGLLQGTYRQGFLCSVCVSCVWRVSLWSVRSENRTGERRGGGGGQAQGNGAAGFEDPQGREADHVQISFQDLVDLVSLGATGPIGPIHSWSYQYAPVRGNHPPKSCGQGTQGIVV